MYSSLFEEKEIEMATAVKEQKVVAMPKKKGKGKLIGIIVAVILVLAAGGFFFMKGMGGGAPDEALATEGGGHGSAKAEHGGGHGAKAEAANGSLVGLDPFIVNLQDNSGTRYLKLNVNLELTADSSAYEIEDLKPQIRDSLIILLSSKSYSDIGTVEGKYQLRDEIVARVNQFLSKAKVKTAFFTEFVIQ